MSWRSQILLLAALSLAGCSSDSSNPAPSNPDPSANTTTTNLNVTTGSDLGSGIPGWVAQGIAVDLYDKTDYSELIALGGSYSPPLVGDPLVALSLTSGSGTSITGELGLSYEDNDGFFGGQWTPNSAFETGTYDGQNLDIIFSDEDITYRIMAPVSNGSVSATIYYRVRQLSDQQCEEVDPGCTSGEPDCPTPPDVVTPCKAYMDPTSASVLEYGTFRTTYSNLQNPWEGTE